MEDRRDVLLLLTAAVLMGGRDADALTARQGQRAVEVAVAALEALERVVAEKEKV